MPLCLSFIATTMLKLSQLRVADTAALHLKDATGEPMYFKDPTKGAGAVEQPVLIHVYGPGSEPYRKAQLGAQRRVMALVKKNRRALEERTPEERTADTAALLADITHSVEGLDLEGRPVREGMQALYADPAAGWVADQVNAFAADWANFSKSAPKD